MGGMGGGGPPPERLSMFSTDYEARRRKQAGLKGATIGAFGTLAATLYNLDHVENATERVQNASWQPYLQNDAPRVAKLQHYDTTMSKYTDALHEATNTSDLEATLQTMQADTSLPESVRSQAHDAHTLSSTLQHPVSKEAYQTTKEYAVETIPDAGTTYRNALVDSVMVDDGYEIGGILSLGLTACLPAILVGRYVGRKAHDIWNQTREQADQ